MPKIKRTDFDRLVRDFHFAELFNNLGWDNTALTRTIKVDEQSYTLHSIAEKTGFFIMRCTADTVPSLPIRRQIDGAFTKVKDFHLIIYTDKAQTEQRWQFVLRAPNRPPKNIEVGWKTGQDTEALWQRTQGLFFSLDEEDNITIVDVTERVIESFGTNAGAVTKKFYDTFKDKHTQFLDFIKGIGSKVDQEWYASLMLNRLMFCYFIQKRGFLDNNINYLSDKLIQTKQNRGKNHFYSFYRDFLLMLFHKGLNEPNQTKETQAEIGKIPYLNGGLFDEHELETTYSQIDIPDEAFEHIFEFFDQWDWHLDTRPNASAKEINPDVIGFIFEKYINERAKMGAYYTKEDITDYISKNSIIPFLFDQVERNGAHLRDCWKLVKDSTDRYIFSAIRHGVTWDIHNGQALDAVPPLPADIEEGIDLSQPNLVERRKTWNREAPPEYALPTEWWREVVERRQRYSDLRQKIDNGEVHAINDFITLNLDIRTFAQDCVQQTDDPDFLWAFYRALSSVSVLDPTCGSGAFLFAALNILEPLYEACLDRMAVFVEVGTAKHNKDFKLVLADANDTNKHPSREYFIHKKIIIHNLYGVDIMHEAVEIAKLRLFLKLMSTVRPDLQKPNLGLEPLPDVDFNLRAGNSLVGFATLGETETIVRMREPMFADDKINELTDHADKVRDAYHYFRKQGLAGGDVRTEKIKLKDELQTLSDKLDHYLALHHLRDGYEAHEFKAWKVSHQPFHWWAQFYEVLYDDEGNFTGFDVVIGNPPYVELKDVKNYSLAKFESITSGDLYNLIIENSLKIIYTTGRLGFIIPMSCFTVDGFKTTQNLIYNKCELVYVSNWSGDAHPAKLFEGVNKRLHITLLKKGMSNFRKTYTSKYTKWYSEERNNLFNIHPKYLEIDFKNSSFFNTSLPKIGSQLEMSIITTLKKIQDSILTKSVKFGPVNLFYTRKVSFFLQFLDFIPEVRNDKGVKKEPSEIKRIFFKDEKIKTTCLASLSSSLFYWFYIINSDCRNLNKREIEAFKISSTPDFVILKHLIDRLMSSYKTNSTLRTIEYKNSGLITVQYFNPRASKPILDEIDTALARHYGFTDEELDFVINYDIKYRMGKESGEEE